VTILPRSCGLLIRWAIHFYGGITPALDMAESVAIYILAQQEARWEDGETTAEHLPFYQNYIRQSRQSAHAGDCPIAPAWLVAPITCDACVYADYVALAFEWLRVENGGILGIAG
jgi:hypothetical protein